MRLWRQVAVARGDKLVAVVLVCMNCETHNTLHAIIPRLHAPWDSHPGGRKELRVNRSLNLESAFDSS